MSERNYKLANVFQGAAQVLNLYGDEVGRVRYRESTFNLRRYLVNRYWVAYDPEGRPWRRRYEGGKAHYVNSRSPADGDPMQFRTRDEAASFLVEQSGG